MAGRVPVARFLVASLCVGSVLLTARGWAETMVQQNVDTRVVLAFRVNPAALQKWLPAPWQIAPIAAGPSKDANLTISFIDRLINQDRERKLIATGTTRLAALVVPVKQAESGGTALMDIREFTSRLRCRDHIRPGYRSRSGAKRRRRRGIVSPGLRWSDGNCRTAMAA
jgi:hypothetical protein